MMNNQEQGEIESYDNAALTQVQGSIKEQPKAMQTLLLLLTGNSSLEAICLNNPACW